MRLSASIAPILLLFWLAAQADALTNERQDARARWNEFRRSEGINWIVKWPPSGNSPEVIRFDRPFYLEGWERGTGFAVREFFHRRSALFGLDVASDQIRVVNERSRRGVSHFRMQQYYRDIPILGGEYMVSVGPTGDLRLVAGQIFPGLNASVTARITESDALSIVLRTNQWQAGQHNVMTRLAIDPTVANGRLVYELDLQGGAHNSWKILVDALDGRILRQRNLTLQAAAQGLVHPPGFGTLDNVQTKSFEVDNFSEVAYLEGPRVSRVSGIGDAAWTDVFGFGTGWDFSFDSSVHNGFFDQVNLYYHADLFIGTFLTSIGFPGFNQPMEVLVSQGSGAWAYPPNVVDIGNANLGPRTSDLMYHEVTHHLLWWFGIDGGQDERAALHEGFADYFACSANNDGFMGEPWSEAGGQGRPVDNDPAQYYYGATLGTAHQQGLVWAGTLWDIRDSVGTVIDEIALESLYYYPSSPSFSIAAASLVQADVDHYSGAYTGVIRNKCQLRSFDIEPLRATIAGPEVLMRSESDTCFADRPYGLPPRSFQWNATAHFPHSASELSLGTSSYAIVTADADSMLAIEVRMRVTDADGDTAYANHWIRVCSSAPMGSGSFGVGIHGGPAVGIGIENQFEFIVVAGGGVCNDSLEYTWEMKCRDPECQYELVGSLASVQFESVRNFDLRVTVENVYQQAVANKTVLLPGIPQLQINGPSTVNCGSSQEYTAVVDGGDPIDSFAWSITPSQVLNPADESTVTIVGAGQTMTLCVSATTTSGLQADGVCKVISSPDYTCTSPAEAVTLRQGTTGDGTIELLLDLASETDIAVRAYDVVGREVARIFEGRAFVGQNRFHWHVKDQKPGVYFVRTLVGTERFTKAIVISR